MIHIELKRALAGIILCLFFLSFYALVADAQTEFSNSDIDRIAKCMYGEYRGADEVQQAAVVWCILNRLDQPEMFGESVEHVITPDQFHGYSPKHPVIDELRNMAIDVIERWKDEKNNVCVWRVLPKEYVFFAGNGKVNRYRINYESNGQFWDWSLNSPYKEGETSDTD